MSFLDNNTQRPKENANPTVLNATELQRQRKQQQQATASSSKKKSLISLVTEYDEEETTTTSTTATFGSTKKWNTIKNKNQQQQPPNKLLLSIEDYIILKVLKETADVTNGQSISILKQLNLWDDPDVTTTMNDTNRNSMKDNVSVEDSLVVNDDNDEENEMDPYWNHYLFRQQRGTSTSTTTTTTTTLPNVQQHPSFPMDRIQLFERNSRLIRDTITTKAKATAAIVTNIGNDGRVQQQQPQPIQQQNQKQQLHHESITADEIYDIIRTIQDPEHPLTLEQLGVVSRSQVSIVPISNEDDHANDDDDEQNHDDKGDVNGMIQQIVVHFTPTIPHCSMATLIGLCIRVKLLRSIPVGGGKSSLSYKIIVRIQPGTHSTEHAINKQLHDKERVAAALDNVHLLNVVNKCIREGIQMSQQSQ